ncbi:MAG TPA: aldehyde dehydrogenase family protein [Mycobacteriales bacterium]|nr:aldehyde dehydrogenase family protein [Mycobacteriales bacterium]
MLVRESLYINGSWVPSVGRGRIAVENPATEQIIGSVPEGDPADVDRAAGAARDALDAWARTPVAERAGYLSRIADGLASRQDEIARTIASEMGAPLKLATRVQAALPVTDVSSMAALLAEYPFEERLGSSLIVHDPVGVVGAITPWNYPLHQITAKVAGALAAGCTVVLKPSELAPLCAYLLFDVIDAVGLPPGVLNLVTGYGASVGEAIAAHPGIDMVTFTGSTRAGRRVSELAAARVKRVALELGGKSANILLPDADLEVAVKAGVANCYVNSGQTCNAWTRMLVHRDSYEEVVHRAALATESYVVGDPFDEKTRLGPLVSAAQRDLVLGHIRRGVEEGARLVVGGIESPLPVGYYVTPTVFADVTSASALAQEEIFGPVLSILPYADEEEAVRIANDSEYGLSGAVWSADPEHAVAVARRLRTGQVDVNGATFNPLAPFGGRKQSGYGRELGRYGLAEFLSPKSLQL